MLIMSFTIIISVLACIIVLGVFRKQKLIHDDIKHIKALIFDQHNSFEHRIISTLRNKKIEKSDRRAF